MIDTTLEREPENMFLEIISIAFARVSASYLRVLWHIFQSFWTMCSFSTFPLIISTITDWSDIISSGLIHICVDCFKELWFLKFVIHLKLLYNPGDYTLWGWQAVCCLISPVIIVCVLLFISNRHTWCRLAGCAPFPHVCDSPFCCLIYICAFYTFTFSNNIYSLFGSNFKFYDLCLSIVLK